MLGVVYTKAVRKALDSFKLKRAPKLGSMLRATRIVNPSRIDNSCNCMACSNLAALRVLLSGMDKQSIDKYHRLGVSRSTLASSGAVCVLYGLADENISTQIYLPHQTIRQRRQVKRFAKYLVSTRSRIRDITLPKLILRLCKDLASSPCERFKLKAGLRPSEISLSTFALVDVTTARQAVLTDVPKDKVEEEEKVEIDKLFDLKKLVSPKTKKVYLPAYLLSHLRELKPITKTNLLVELLTSYVRGIRDKDDLYGLNVTLSSCAVNRSDGLNTSVSSTLVSCTV